MTTTLHEIAVYRATVYQLDCILGYYPMDKSESRGWSACGMLLTSLRGDLRICS